MLGYQSVIISIVCLRLLINWLFVTKQVIQNTGHRKHEWKAHKHGNCPGVSRNDCFHSKKIMFHWIRIIMICGRTRTLLFQHIPTLLPLHLQQPRNHHISILRRPWKTQPCIQHEPCQRQLWGKAWTKTRPTGRTWQQRLDRFSPTQS